MESTRWSEAIFVRTCIFNHRMFLFSCSELQAGTLRENRIEDGTEIRLVPAVESGVMVSVLLARVHIAVPVSIC